MASAMGVHRMKGKGRGGKEKDKRRREGKERAVLVSAMVTQHEKTRTYTVGVCDGHATVCAGNSDSRTAHFLDSGALAVLPCITRK